MLIGHPFNRPGRIGYMADIRSIPSCLGVLVGSYCCGLRLADMRQPLGWPEKEQASIEGPTEIALFHSQMEVMHFFKVFNTD